VVLRPASSQDPARVGRSAWRSFAQRAKAQQEVTFDGVTGGTPWTFPQMMEPGYQKM
jgi:hypothetical protein